MDRTKYSTTRETGPQKEPLSLQGRKNSQQRTRTGEGFEEMPKDTVPKKCAVGGANKMLKGRDKNWGRGDWMARQSTKKREI